jgi:hypothetical protein
MVTNVFFNNFESFAEQTLIENLIIESIRIYGHDLHYCPRTIIAKDEIWASDALSEYNNAYLIEMYIKNVESFDGEGDFLSKFNIQIRDEITFTVAQRIFHAEVGAQELIQRPREGDLIYFPLTQKVYVVKFVEHEAVFYQMGNLQTYDLRCELFEYSNETLNTGVFHIDILAEENRNDADLSNAEFDEAGGLVLDPITGRPIGVDDYDFDDPFSQNSAFQNKANTIIDWSEKNPFGEDEY